MMGFDMRCGGGSVEGSAESPVDAAAQAPKVGLARRGWLVNCTAGLAAAALPGLAGAASPAPAGRTLLVVGDSLSAEYGIARGAGWVALLDQRLAQEAQARSQAPWRVVNASVSGDTTSGGRSRLPALLAKEKPAVVIVELGGNDALRGLPLQSTRENLEAMVKASRAAGARVLIAGMQMPPNYGRRYGEAFAALYAAVARDTGSALVPFLLAGVADVPQAERLFQPDRIHPLAQAHPIILGNVWPVLRPLLQEPGKPPQGR